MPALPSDRPVHSLLLDITSAGDRLVAVGELGHIFYTDDQGASWHQAEVPVRVTLTAVHFPTPKAGWAVGHDGVVLSSRDGGITWVKQLDGYSANRITKEHAEALLAMLKAEIDGASPEQQTILRGDLDDLAYQVDDVISFAEEGATRPFLEVWFKNEYEGWVLGAYGLIMYTDDGGQSWRSLFGHLNNPSAFHYYSMIAVGDALVISGEAGTFYRSLDKGISWEAMPMPYEGTIFGLLSDGQALLAYGLRGHLFRSENQGDSWQALKSGTESLLAGGTLKPNGEWILVGSDGVVLISRDGGRNFETHIDSERRAYSSVAATASGLILTTGIGGFHRPLAPSTATE